MKVDEVATWDWKRWKCLFWSFSQKNNINL